MSESPLDEQAAKELLQHLNTEAGVNWPVTPRTIRAAALALKAVNGDLAGAQQVVSEQVRELRGDAKKRHWLRPHVLFEPDRFAVLYAERGTPAYLEFEEKNAPTLEELEAARERESDPQRRRQLLKQISALTG